MDTTMIVMTVVIIAGLGIVIGIALGAAEKRFAVKTDPREEAILEVLPGNNCGGCGYPGCAGLAAAIVRGEAEVNGCQVGGSKVAVKVAGIMKVEASEVEHKVAYVKCSGFIDSAQNAYDYSGIETCLMASHVVNKGPKACIYGCLGYGDCVKVCDFAAMHIVRGIATVNWDNCRACRKCIKACPKKLIELVPYDKKYHVRCSSTEKGKATMKVCTVGCIGCGICEKTCRQGAIKVHDNVAHIDYMKCINCGECASVCPKGVIR